jgi:hypothetical protein
MTGKPAVLTDELIDLADRAAHACERARTMYSARRLADGRRWLMKALYASDQIRRLTTPADRADGE